MTVFNMLYKQGKTVQIKIIGSFVLIQIITSCPCKKSGILFQYVAQYRNSIKMDKWMLCNIQIWRKRCFLLYFYTLNNGIKLCVVLRALNLS